MIEKIYIFDHNHNLMRFYRYKSQIINFKLAMYKILSTSIPTHKNLKYPSQYKRTVRKLMQTRNSPQTYGWVSIFLHWGMATFLIGLYFVGDYMVELNYYNPLYHILPFWHKSIGVALGFALLFRIVWNLTNPKPKPLQNTPPLTHNLAKLGHLGLYALIIIMLISGYLISTAKGKGIEVFGWFEIPALLGVDEQRGEIAGKVHAIAGFIFISLVAVHALAALAHHFYWKDSTLTRMLGISTK